MEDVVAIQCPYCAESLDVFIDPQTVGATVRDCDVCCRPWQLHVERDPDDGSPRVSVTRAQ